MATPEQTRAAELRAQIAANTPRKEGGLPLGGVNGAVAVGSDGGDLQVLLEGGNVQDYSAWLATLELAQLEALITQITTQMEREEQEARARVAQATEATAQPATVDIPMTVPGVTPAVTDIPVAVPGENPRKDIVTSTTNLAEKEVRAAITQTSKLPTSIDAFTKMDDEGQAAVREMFKDGKAKPVYRVTRGADGSYGRGEVVIKHDDGREESFDSFLGKQPDNLVTPLRNSLKKVEQGAAVAPEQQASADASAVVTPPASQQQQQTTDTSSQQQAADAPATQSQGPTNYRPIEREVTYQESYVNSMTLAEKKGRSAMGFGAGLTTMAVVALTATNPWIGIPLVVGATMLARPLGGMLGTAMAGTDALDDIARQITVDLAKLSVGERTATYDELAHGFAVAVAGMGGRAAAKYFAARKDEILEAASNMPKDPEALRVVEQVVNDRELAKRRQVEEPDGRWSNTAQFAVGLGTTAALFSPMAPVVLAGGMPSIVGTLGSLVYGGVMGTVVGGTVGTVADVSRGENLAQENSGKLAGERIANLNPAQQADVMRALEYVIPSDSLPQVQQSLQNRVAQNSRAESQQQSQQPTPQQRPPQQVIMEYAEQVSRTGNMELAQSLANLAGGRVQNGDVDRVVAHVKEGREQGTLPPDVAMAVQSVVTSGRGNQQSRAEQQAAGRSGSSRGAA